MTWFVVVVDPDGKIRRGRKKKHSGMENAARLMALGAALEREHALVRKCMAAEKLKREMEKKRT